MWCVMSILQCNYLYWQNDLTAKIHCLPFNLDYEYITYICYLLESYIIHVLIDCKIATIKQTVEMQIQNMQPIRLESSEKCRDYTKKAFKFELSLRISSCFCASFYPWLLRWRHHLIFRANFKLNSNIFLTSTITIDLTFAFNMKKPFSTNEIPWMTWQRCFKLCKLHTIHWMCIQLCDTEWILGNQKWKSIRKHLLERLRKLESMKMETAQEVSC